MKKLVLMALSICLVSGACAQTPKTIKLDAPNKQRGEVTMQAFEKRRSTREYADRKLSPQDLSDLLWATNGMNRPAESKHTSPTARNKQEIDIYACFEDGAYYYDAKSHELQMVTEADVRTHIAAVQPFAATAPVCLVIVADMDKVGDNSELSREWAAVDAGIVSQSISLFCAGCGFGTVPRGYMNKEDLHKALGLRENQVIYLNHPVGYFK